MYKKSGFLYRSAGMCKENEDFFTEAERGMSYRYYIDTREKQRCPDNVRDTLSNVRGLCHFKKLLLFHIVYK